MSTSTEAILLEAIRSLQSQQAQMQATLSLLTKRLDRQHLFLKPGITKTPEEQYKETVLANVELMREAISAGEWEQIDSLTCEWGRDYKVAVSELLTTQEKETIRKIKALYNQYMEPANKAHDEATEKYNSAIALLKLPEYSPKQLSQSEIDSVKAPEAGITYQQLENGHQIPVAAKAEEKIPRIAEEKKPDLTAPTYTGWGTPKITMGREVVDSFGNENSNDEMSDKDALHSIMPQPIVWGRH